MIYLGKKGINNGYILQYEEGNPVPIAVLDVIFYDVLEEVKNTKKKLIGGDVGIEE